LTNELNPRQLGLSSLAMVVIENNNNKMPRKAKTNPLAAFGGRITRYWININEFVPRPAGQVQIVAASFGRGHKLAVTYAVKGGAQ
jgi:hypothetical protein